LAWNNFFTHEEITDNLERGIHRKRPDEKNSGFLPFRSRFSVIEHGLAVKTRALEQLLLELYSENRLSGTVHTCIGQEFCSAALQPFLRTGSDAVFGTHRCHGHYLAYGAPLEGLLAELMGREGGVCRGRGGSQHLHYKRFFSSGIQGGTALMATGFAWALSRSGNSEIAVAQMGDGTLGEGAVYEAFLFAALLRVPVLFFIEWNGCAQSTDTSLTTPGDVVQRVSGFGLKVDRRDDLDPAALSAHLGGVVETVRQGEPFVQIIETRRLKAHSKGDDERPAELVARLESEDPLTAYLNRDPQAGRLFDAERLRLRELADQVEELPLETYLEEPALAPMSREFSNSDYHWFSGGTERVVELLNQELHRIMEEHDQVVVLGEDIADPYGGAFKVTRGLSTRFSERVFSTPISEAAIVGVGNGAALGGLRPIAEIMFADFVTLAADSLINHAAKFHYMYGGAVTCPVTVRLVSGGGRGYGPTHSQSTESLFLGVPGIRVVALSQRHHAGRLLRSVVLESPGPTVFVENKLLYSKRSAEPLLDLELVAVSSQASFPPLFFRPNASRPPDVTLVTYGGMTSVAEAAMRELFLEEELAFDYLVYTQLWPLDAEPVLESVARTRRLLVLEEGVAEFGFGAGLLAKVAQRARAPFRSRLVGAEPVPIPCARHLEKVVLPDFERVVAQILEIL
jgi:2-oxoisovalerate dehydrogenase E1 component